MSVSKFEKNCQCLRLQHLWLTYLIWYHNNFLVKPYHLNMLISEFFFLDCYSNSNSIPGVRFWKNRVFGLGLNFRLSGLDPKNSKSKPEPENEKSFFGFGLLLKTFLFENRKGLFFRLLNYVFVIFISRTFLCEMSQLILNRNDKNRVSARHIMSKWEIYA